VVGTGDDYRSTSDHRDDGVEMAHDGRPATDGMLRIESLNRPDPGFPNTRDFQSRARGALPRPSL